MYYAANHDVWHVSPQRTPNGSGRALVRCHTFPRERVMDYDEILGHLGELGPWNLLMQALIYASITLSGVPTMVYPFAGD